LLPGVPGPVTVVTSRRAFPALDIDSHKPAQFDEDDVPPLTKILNLLQPYL